MIKGFVFDLDGVLTDTAEYHYLAWQELGEKIGISIDRVFNEQLKGISRMDSLDRILAYGNKSMIYSKEEKIRLADEKNEEYKKLITKISSRDLLPGIKEFMADLKQADMKIALASASKNGPDILNQLGIAGLFDTIVDPAALTHGKPDPEIFIKGAKQLGLSPKECIGVEDAEAGIQSINAAGMFSVGVGTQESMKLADVFVSNTTQLDFVAILNKAQKK
ncbi:beta-phosphoglucomutase [Carnobacterium funditum]|uniref:beta-phosphoglucomutase n=1 Tax=Carnobacterium funditum TaxID=2752 RepID=UPI0005583B64|nr:beta-phosphoglucomutase [Carnobacterium funditum]